MQAYLFTRLFTSCCSFVALTTPCERPVWPLEFGREPFLPIPETFFCILPEDGRCGLDCPPTVQMPPVNNTLGTKSVLIAMKPCAASRKTGVAIQL